MKHVMPFIIKFVISFILLYLVFGRVGGLSFIDIALTTAVLVFFSYLVGDMIILPRTNNIIAALADFAFAFFIIGFMVYVLISIEIGFLLRSGIAALGLAAFEVFFHMYLKRRVFPDRNHMEKREYERLQYQTEYAEEIRTDDIKKTKK